jgi:hypothetical protein
MKEKLIEENFWLSAYEGEGFYIHMDRGEELGEYA